MQLKMFERKNWSVQEDEKLKQIILANRNMKWRDVSLALEKQGIFGRTQKKCRQRWHNHLNPNIKSQCWTQQEETILFDNQKMIGNKWSKIAEKLAGRSDNSIKNHFYSTLRKGVRVLNRFILTIKNKSNRQITPNTLSKIVNVAEYNFSNPNKVSRELIDKCIQIKQQLIDISKQKQISANELNQIINKITTFNKSYHKRRFLKKKNQQQEFLEQMEQIKISKKNRNIQKKSPENSWTLKKQFLINTSIIQVQQLKRNANEQQQLQHKNIDVGIQFQKLNFIINQSHIYEHEMQKITNSLALFNSENQFGNSNVSKLCWQDLEYSQNINEYKFQDDILSLEVSKQLSGELTYFPEQFKICQQFFKDSSKIFV